MPRRDLTQERTAQILDAFERCVVKHGLDGTSLEQVAEEAGVKRSILRHYVGNRDALINAMVERVVKKSSQQVDTMVAYLPQVGQGRIETLLSFLFQYEGGSAEETLVVETLVAAAGRYPHIQGMLRQSMEEFIEKIADQLKLVFPKVPRKRCWSVAYGIVSLYLTYDSLVPLKLPPAHQAAALESARCLVASLGQEAEAKKR